MVLSIIYLKAEKVRLKLGSIVIVSCTSLFCLAFEFP